MEELLIFLKVGKEVGSVTMAIGLCAYIVLKLLPRINALEIQSALDKQRLTSLENKNKEN